MLISKEELRFDFKGAHFDLKRDSERKLLGWVFNQFLYGEVTGIQCGHWLYHAPHLGAAAFLAKQAGEELSHVRKILRILSLLGETPAEAHRAIKFLSTGMMGGSWGEHVTMEMALGEGLVLSVFYAMTDTIQHPEIHRILESATTEEERHVEFGERETLDWLVKYPGERKLLLGLALVQVFALHRLKNFVLRRIVRTESPEHSVLSQFGGFYDQVLRMFEVRIERLGLSDKPLVKLTWFEKFSLILAIPFRKVSSRLRIRKTLLTSTYLRDPALLAEIERYRPS